jgi:hypothetical protein
VQLLLILLSYEKHESDSLFAVVVIATVPFPREELIMFFFGPGIFFVFAVMTGGTSSTDLIALVQPKHYFQYRDWEPSIDKMVDIAFEDPKDAKAHVAQLTCLRYLADESAALKKSAKYADQRKMLEVIAKGERAQDEVGFAKEYAQRVLDKLDGTKPAAVKAKSIREDSLNWFPAEATLAGAIDVVQARQPGAPDALKDLVKMMRDNDRRELYNVIEKCGNIRLERVSFAFTEGGRDKSKIYVRISGKGNQKWIADAIAKLDGGGGGRMEIKSIKADDKTPITLIHPDGKGRPPVLMLVGNTDFLIVGTTNNDGDQQGLVDEVLAARSKKKNNVTTGAIKDRFAKVPDKALAFLVGQVPDELKREFGRNLNLDPVPPNILAYVERAQQGVDLFAESSMANGDEGGKLVRKIASLRKEGIAALNEEMKNPPRAGQPPVPYRALINLMESIQVDNKAERVQVRVHVPDDLMQQLISGWMMFAGPGELDLPPPPEKKCDK